MRIKKISDYLHVDPEKNTMPIQVRVPRALALEVKREIKKKGLSWNEFITACLQSFADELKCEK